MIKSGNTHPKLKSTPLFLKKTPTKNTLDIGETLSCYIRLNDGWFEELQQRVLCSSLCSSLFSTTPSKEAIPTHGQPHWDYSPGLCGTGGSEVVVRGPQLENVNPDKLWLPVFWSAWLISFSLFWFALGYIFSMKLH